ncbi:MAG: flagellar biosynthesis protein FlhA [Gammaproteobacteria bacterium]|nr:flagellar biosynthesis protein FlhA [Gammaproteobacteria bacterium]
MAMTAADAMNELRTGASRGLGAPILLLVILGMMVIPLRPFVLDVLFTFNIALSIVVMLAVIYVMRPLDFSSFPTILLLTTLMRLSLNVASTRVVLLHGHEGTDAAGKVIEAFGHFVVGGNYTVGLIVFIILTVINFVVVTKGAGRISEVSARFTLDAMPGKQMAIDADLNAGLIKPEEARQRRNEVREEADFYGSMDGASKFVRGDAVAGILILFINVIGGLLIGTLQHDLPLAVALKNYTLLTIGDGLVAQVPALMLSTAVAMLVTRISRSQDMSQQVTSQVFGKPKALAITAGVLGLMGMIPGMPNFAFLLLAAAAGGLAWLIASRAREAEAAKPAEGEEAAEQSKPAEPRELSWDDVAPVDAIGLEVGYRLIPLVDRRQGAELMGRIKGVRKKLTQELGFLIPAVHVRDNLELTPGAYRILLHGVPVAQGEIHPDRELALNPGRVLGPVQGIVTKDPAFGLDAVWIEPGARTQAQAQGYTVVDAATVVATHLSQILKDHSHELLGHEEVQQLLNSLAKAAPKLVEDVTPKLLPLSAIVKVLQALLAERVPIRNMRAIAEALAEAAARSQDPVALIAAVRIALGRQIVQDIVGMNAELPVFALAPALERMLQDSAQTGNQIVEPGLAERLHKTLMDGTQRQEAAGQPAVLLVPPALRPILARFTRHTIPGLNVLAYPEVPENRKIRLAATIA